MIILIGLFLSVITVEPKSIQRKKAAGNAEQRARQLDQGSATVEDRYENGEEQVLQKMLRIRQAVQLQAADSVEKIMQAADKAEEPDEAKRESTGKAVENATTTTKTSIQNKYAVTEDAEENKKIIVIEKQSKAADQKSAKEEALTAKTGGLEQLIVKAQSTWRAKAAYGPTVYYTDKGTKEPLLNNVHETPDRKLSWEIPSEMRLEFWKSGSLGELWKKYRRSGEMLPLLEGNKDLPMHMEG